MTLVLDSIEDILADIAARANDAPINPCASVLARAASSSS